jgi:hypothetical protein
VRKVTLEKFFDHVCHDRLMSRLAERIADKRLLKLIRGYLQAGILDDGLVMIPEAGTPQGSPLSPFLSNVVGRLFGRTGTVSLTTPCVGRNARPHSGVAWHQAPCCGQLPEDSTSRAWDATPQEANVLDKDKKGESVTGEGET